MEIEAAMFATVEGSMTSDDGQTFYLRAKQFNDRDLMLGFPHSQISAIIENAAVQLAHGRDEDGHQIAAAFKTSAFELGRGPGGETVLTMVVGKARRLSFLLPPDMQAEVLNSLSRLLPKH